jgi:hypothetical protein
MIIEINLKRNGRNIEQIVLIMIFITLITELKSLIEIFLLRLDLDLLLKLLLLRILEGIFQKEREIDYVI